MDMDFVQGHAQHLIEIMEKITRIGRAVLAKIIIIISKFKKSVTQNMREQERRCIEQ